MTIILRLLLNIMVVVIDILIFFIFDFYQITLPESALKQWHRPGEYFHRYRAH